MFAARKFPLPVITGATSRIPPPLPAPAVLPPPAPSANISLDGNQSLGSGTLNYFWSIAPPPPPGASIVGVPTLSNSALNVQAVGTYVVQLQVGNGTDTDTIQSTINVSEPAITADFTPATGNQAVAFSGSPSRGNITLTSTSSGSPTNCRWQVSGPAGATVDGSSILDETKSCGAPATLNVSFAAFGSAYSVTLTASNINSQSVTHTIVVQNGSPAVANIGVGNTAGLTFRSPVASQTFGAGGYLTGSLTSATAGAASVALNSTGSSGAGTLSYQWSITSQPDSTNGPASLSIATAAAPTLTVKATGSYQIRLIVTDQALQTDTKFANFTVTPNSGTTFANITTLLGNSPGLGCIGCHAGTGNPANNSGTAPDWTSPGSGGTLWFRLLQRIDLITSSNSLLLLNPSNTTNATNTTPHGGGCQTGFGCDASGTANYTTIQNWILDGAPPGN